MCGLAGAVLSRRADGFSELERAVRRMSARMVARGPDASGHWVDLHGEAILGHRRLAILDLDSRADQPMISADARYAIVFNGEIYNFRALRRELENDGISFRTQSDTEVLLWMFARHGRSMLPRLRGMFSLAIWDALKKELFIARDPYGIKPLYIAKCAHGVLVSSQVKALLECGLLSREPNLKGQAGFWLFGSVPEPDTWFRDIWCLPAGHFASITADGASAPTSWCEIGESWIQEDRQGSEVDGLVRLKVREALFSSVKAHLVSDVPVGIFLSGGIDSGALAALMVEAGASQLKGVTLAYEEFAGTPGDESPVAARLAGQLGIQHTVRTITRREFETDFPRIMAAMDQPTVDGINTWYASKAASELGLKVVVSGVGGDELFQGYSSFDQLPNLVSWRNKLWHVPLAPTLLTAICAWRAMAGGNPRWKLAPELLSSIEGAWALRRGLFSVEELFDLTGKTLFEISGHTFIETIRDLTGPLPLDGRLALGAIESKTYLKNQLLRDSDWASMDHGVELRTPFVDAFLLQDVSPLFPAFRRFPNKRLLAQAPRLPLPEYLTGRPKTGFGIPIQRWLASMGRARSGDGMSRGWARELSSEIYRAG
jgi:asparagine synthase (glutamine-hydrolysing)